MLNYFGLSLANLKGQSYDGCSNMLGMFNYKSMLHNKTYNLLIIGVHYGKQTIVLKEQPLDLNTHCFSQKLNLSISKACKTPVIRNMFGTVGFVSVFLSSSAK